MHNVKLLVYQFLSLISGTLALFILNPWREASLAERIPLVSCFLLIFEPLKVLFIGYIGYKGRGRAPFSVLWEKSYVSKNLNRIGLNLLFISLIIVLIILCLGAPLLSELDVTFFLALCVTFTSVLPILITDPSLPLSTSILRIINFMFNPSARFNQWDSSFALNLKLVALFTWFGAFLLKLDWIVSWKVYPITSIMTSLYGYLIASLFNLCTISVRF
ncbi:uncharacterized protein C1450.15 [Tetranychus urticae]|nr:uncharacterized protein C1450.15 [Tetranychus urticae]